MTYDEFRPMLTPVWEELRDLARRLDEHGQDYIRAIDEMQMDAEALAYDYGSVTSDISKREIRRCLEELVPARAESIKATFRALVGADAREALDRGLEAGVRVAVVLLQAFLK